MLLPGNKSSPFMYSETATKYLDKHLDHKLSWRDHTVMKWKQIELKVKELYRLLGRKSQLSIENKLLIYKTIIKPIWTYGIEIWGLCQ